MINSLDCWYDLIERENVSQRVKTCLQCDNTARTMVYINDSLYCRKCAIERIIDDMSEYAMSIMAIYDEDELYNELLQMSIYDIADTFDLDIMEDNI